MEGGRLILQQVIAREMNGAGHVTGAPVIINRPELATYYVDGHVDVTVDRPFKHDVYRVTIDTPYLHVAVITALPLRATLYGKRSSNDYS